MRRARVHHSPEYETLLSRHLHESAIAALRATARTDVAVVACDVIGPHDDLAAITICKGIGIDRGISTDIGAEGILHGALAMQVAADQHRPAASVAGHGNIGMIEQTDLLAEHMDCAASLTTACSRRINRTGHTDNAFVAARQHDHAVAFRHALGPDHALVVHHRLDDVGRRACGQGHHAAVSLKRAGVGDVGSEALAVRACHAAGDGIGHHEFDQAVAAHI